MVSINPNRRHTPFELARRCSGPAPGGLHGRGLVRGYATNGQDRSMNRRVPPHGIPIRRRRHARSTVHGRRGGGDIRARPFKGAGRSAVEASAARAAQVAGPGTLRSNGVSTTTLIACHRGPGACREWPLGRAVPRYCEPRYPPCSRPSSACAIAPRQGTYSVTQGRSQSDEVTLGFARGTRWSTKSGSR